MLSTYNWKKLTKIAQQKILLRPILADNKNIQKKVKHIIEQVRLSGDQALLRLTKKYDRVSLMNLQVTSLEFKNALKQVNPRAKKAIKFAKKQIETNHQSQLPQTQIINTCEGVYCERQARPIETIGLYIPGGSAPLVSTVLMLAVPARMAKCPLIILCTPPNKTGEIDPHLLFAAKLCGIQYIYKVGGAQSIAAMAYGTKTIPKVAKIFGPGNEWVTSAKLHVSRNSNGTGIDMPAGPSELMIIADDSANPEYVAADLLSQAEHGIDSQVMLVALSEQFVARVLSSIKKQLSDLPRSEIIKQSLTHSRSIFVDHIEEAVSICNRCAPEHLILHVRNPKKYTKHIQNAGAVFLGPWAPETVGDYVTGANHVLPTYGYARHLSGLSVCDFMKYISFQTVTKKGLEKMGPFAETLAEIEGLKAHKNAVSLRLTKEFSK